MSVDRSKLRNGDTVLVRAVVRDDLIQITPYVFVDFETTHGSYTPVLAASIVSVEPRPLQVGDRVRVGSGGQPGTIVALADNGEAWVNTDTFGHCTYDTRDLVRA